MRQTIEHDLPEEARFLQLYDEFCAGLETVVDMPNRSVDLLFRFLRRNNGKFSKRALTEEFIELTEREVGQIERLYADTLGRL